MTGRVAVFCNGIVPGSGVPNGAQGLRARGLQLGLSQLGIDVDIVSKAGAVHLQLKKWDKDFVAIPEYWRILPDDICEQKLNTDYETLILPNWAGLPDFQKNDSLNLIYDFFSPTIVEHSFIVDEESLKKRKQKKISILNQTDHVIANGDGRADYGQSFLADAGLNHISTRPASVRMAMERFNQAPPDDDIFRIFVGGFDQAWTKGLDIHALAAIAREVRCEIHAIGLGYHLHNSNNSAQISEMGKVLRDCPNIIYYPVSSFEKYREINARCHVALDVYERNRERELCYSTRAISSLASGCPVVTMDFTEVGKLVVATSAGWVLDEYSEKKVIDILNKISSDTSDLKYKRNNTENFYSKYCTPANEAKHILEFL